LVARSEETVTSEHAGNIVKACGPSDVFPEPRASFVAVSKNASTPAAMMRLGLV